MISEWDGTADTNAALDYYNAIVGVIEGKVKAAKGVKELNAALSSVIAGVWLSLGDGKLHADFQLRPLPNDPTRPNALAQILSDDLAGRRMYFMRPTQPGPPERPDDQPKVPEDPSEIVLTRAALRGAKPDTSPSSTAAFRRCR